MRQSYGGRVQFLFVYVSEALHAIPQFADAPEVACPGITLGPADRRERILSGLRAFDLPFVCLDAGDTPEVERAYTAWPMRLVVVGRDGRIALDAGQGMPSGWDLRAVEACLKELAGDESQGPAI